MKYEKCAPIIPRPVAVYLVEFEDGETRLDLWSPDILFADVLEQTKVIYGKPFKLSIIQVGTFIINKNMGSYTPDGRRVSSDGEVSI